MEYGNTCKTVRDKRAIKFRTRHLVSSALQILRDGDQREIAQATSRSDSTISRRIQSIDGVCEMLATRRVIGFVREGEKVIRESDYRLYLENMAELSRLKLQVHAYEKASIAGTTEAFREEQLGLFN